MAEREHRVLTQQEKQDLELMAATTTPLFGIVTEEVEHPTLGKTVRVTHNAEWEDHHPVARAIWEKRGLKPKGK
jgi:hypothetical protein